MTRARNKPPYYQTFSGLGLGEVSWFESAGVVDHSKDDENWFVEAMRDAMDDPEQFDQRNQLPTEYVAAPTGADKAKWLRRAADSESKSFKDYVDRLVNGRLEKTDFQKLPGHAAKIQMVDSASRVDRFMQQLIEYAEKRTQAGEKPSLTDLNGMLLLAFQYYNLVPRSGAFDTTEDSIGDPVRASVLRGLACVLELVTWKDKEPVPGSSIRDCLNLPNGNISDFLVAARMRKDGLTNKAIATELGYDQKQFGPSRWGADLDRFADAGLDPFFPFGLDGAHVKPIEGGGLQEIIRRCRVEAGKRRDGRTPADKEEKKTSGQIRNPRQRDTPQIRRVTLFRVALSEALRGVPPSDEFVLALAHQLSRVNEDDLVLVPQRLLETTALSELRLYTQYVEAARLDGEAVWAAALADKDRGAVVSDDEDRWAAILDSEAVWAMRDLASTAPADEVHKRILLSIVFENWALNSKQISKRIDTSDATINLWRRESGYQMRSMFAAFRGPMSVKAWEKYNK